MITRVTKAIFDWHRNQICKWTCTYTKTVTRRLCSCVLVCYRLEPISFISPSWKIIDEQQEVLFIIYPVAMRHDDFTSLSHACTRTDLIFESRRILVSLITLFDTVGIDIAPSIVDINYYDVSSLGGYRESRFLHRCFCHISLPPRYFGRLYLTTCPAGK